MNFRSFSKYNMARDNALMDINIASLDFIY